MKESSVRETVAEQMWDSVISLLKGADEAGTWAFWRERFQCTHPKHNPEEIDNPARYAEACFHAAKRAYCKYKTELDKYGHEMQNGIILSYPGKTEDCELFNAMKRVVEEEMAQQLEEQILSNEEQPQGYWEGDEYLALPDSNVELDNDSY